MPDTLKDYAERMRTTVCFDTIIDIKKAIQEKDDATALVSLGELREQITLLDRYIASLEKNSGSQS